MRRTGKRVLCFVLTLIILLGGLPLSAAVGVDYSVFRTSAKAATVVNSGKCGENVTWTLDNEGLLSIGGTGEMSDYNYSNCAPWYDYRKTIKKVVIQSGITSVGSWAFYNCDSINEVVLQEGVINVGYSAFYDVCGPFTIQLPKSLQDISTYDYYNVSGVSAFFVDANNPYFMSKDGVLYNKDMTALIAYPGQKETESFVLPDSVVSIESFYGPKLTSVTVGKSFEDWKNSFASCYNLEAIYCASSNPFYKSVDGVLFCTDFGDSHGYVLSAYPNAKTDGSYTVPSQVTYILYDAINNSHLKELILPNNLKEIGYHGIDAYHADVTVMNPDCVFPDNCIDSVRRIIGLSGSTAETYANENNYTFKVYCPHANTVIRDTRTAKCSQPGLKGETYCNDCNEVLRFNELIYVDHKDTNKDGKCDVCKMETGDIQLNMEKTFPVLDNGKTQWIKFIPTLTATYTVKKQSDSENYVETKLYDQNKVQLAYYWSEDNLVLESGKTYYFLMEASGSSTVTLQLSILHYTTQKVEELEHTCTGITRAAYTCILCGETVNDGYDNMETYPVNEHTYKEQTQTAVQTDPHSIQYTVYECTKCGMEKAYAKPFNETNTVTKIEAFVGDKLIENVSGVAETGYFRYNIGEADISFQITYADGYKTNTDSFDVDYGEYDLFYEHPTAQRPWGVGKHKVTAVFYTGGENPQEYYRVDFYVEVIKNPIKSVKATYLFVYPEGYYYTYRLFPGWVQLKVTYNDNTTVELTADQAKHFSMLSQSEEKENGEIGIGTPAHMLGDYLRAEQPGTYKVYAEYMGVKTSFDVTVKAVEKKTYSQMKATELEKTELQSLSDESTLGLCHLNDNQFVQWAYEWMDIDENSYVRHDFFIIYDEKMKEVKKIDSRIIVELLQIENKDARIIVENMQNLNGELFLTVSAGKVEAAWQDDFYILKTKDLESFELVSVPESTEDAQGLWMWGDEWSIDFAAGQYVLTALEYTNTKKYDIAMRAFPTANSRLVYYTSKDLENWKIHYGPALGKDCQWLAMNEDVATEIIRADANGVFSLNSYSMGNGDAADYETYGLYYTDDFETYQLLTDGIPEKSEIKISQRKRADDKVYYSIVENTIPESYHFGVAYGCSYGNPYTRTSLYCFNETTKEIHNVYTTTDPVSACVINNYASSPTLFLEENGQQVFRTISGEKGTVIEEGLSPIDIRSIQYYGGIPLSDYAALGFCITEEEDEETEHPVFHLYLYDESGKVSKSELISDTLPDESIDDVTIMYDTDSETYQLWISFYGSNYIADVSNAIAAHLNGHSHISADIPAKNATCEVAGREKGTYCAICGKVLTEPKVLPATGKHVWNEGEINTEATCTNTGIKTYTCTVCSATKTENINKTAHKLTKTAAKAATCTAAGNVEYYTCSVCKKTFSDAKGTKAITDVTVKAAGHKLTKIPAKAATCTTAGNVEYYTCSVCKKTFSDATGTKAITNVTVKATGHKLSKTAAKAAT
ncbi:MAG: leucine-rich repeat domain-containing protein, partial [Clostridia bacterium]|nr:leucine-rich repeat domain-containing protein [Clostridia bacterium]